VYEVFVYNVFVTEREEGERREKEGERGRKREKEGEREREREREGERRREREREGEGGGREGGREAGREREIGRESTRARERHDTSHHPIAHLRVQKRAKLASSLVCGANGRRDEAAGQDLGALHSIIGHELERVPSA